MAVSPDVIFASMDYKQLRRQVAERLGRPVADVDALTKGLGTVVRQCMADMDTVAVPTFGTFAAKVHPDCISTDLSTGRSLLLPPEVNIEFTPGGMLLKKLRHE